MNRNRFALAAAGLAGMLALAACNASNSTPNGSENIDLNVTEITNVEEPAPAANTTANVAASNETAEVDEVTQTQEDAVATGMTARIDRGNETDAQ